MQFRTSAGRLLAAAEDVGAARGDGDGSSDGDNDIINKKLGQPQARVPLSSRKKIAEI